jgi:hypothetical protein
MLPGVISQSGPEIEQTSPCDIMTHRDVLFLVIDPGTPSGVVADLATAHDDAPAPDGLRRARGLNIDEVVL